MSIEAVRDETRGSRLGVILPVAAVWLLVSAAIRGALLVYEGDAGLFGAGPILRIFATGVLYDLAAFAWIAIPFTLGMVLWPGGPRGRIGHAGTALLLTTGGIIGLGFLSLGEVLFWNEFAARFNFIAVDYLVYTREVTGNIAESYPLGWLVAITLGLSLPVAIVAGIAVWRLGRRRAPSRGMRLALVPLHALLLAAVFFGLGEGPHDRLGGTAEKELASNGAYSLFRAFRNNDLDYAKYYRTLPPDMVEKILGEELEEAGLKAGEGERVNPFAHIVTPAGPARKHNVVLITIESLGADYVEAFGGWKGLTPNLSRLVDDSLVFDRLYATGLRTVRGLEAVTLSIPPTPGRAVPVRERNHGLVSLGGVLRDNGYRTLYLYGGYSYFDNMENFFSGAGYEVFDRTDIPDEDIDHETIWGVADEDLFDFTLDKLGAVSNSGQPFFAHIMTTSNHRPFTFPDGRIDIPSHSGRDGAVKYTDWAIGRFLDQARLQPWFDDTVFVILADHTSHGRGRTDLPPENYRIPMWIYAPGIVAPGRVGKVASQIDVAPTVLGLLGIAYESPFFGQDILDPANHHERAFMANYLTVGYMENGLVVELAPQGRVRVVRAATGETVPADDPDARELVGEAVSFYLSAAEEIRRTTRP